MKAILHDLSHEARVEMFEWVTQQMSEHRIHDSSLRFYMQCCEFFGIEPGSEFKPILTKPAVDLFWKVRTLLALKAPDSPLTVLDLVIPTCHCGTKVIGVKESRKLLIEDQYCRHPDRLFEILHELSKHDGKDRFSLEVIDLLANEADATVVMIQLEDAGLIKTFDVDLKARPVTFSVRLSRAGRVVLKARASLAGETTL